MKCCYLYEISNKTVALILGFFGVLVYCVELVVILPYMLNIENGSFNPLIDWANQTDAEKQNNMTKFTLVMTKFHDYYLEPTCIGLTIG